MLNFRFEILLVIGIIFAYHTVIFIFIFVADTFARGICGIGNDVFIGM